MKAVRMILALVATSVLQSCSSLPCPAVEAGEVPLIYVPLYSREW